MNVLTGRSRSQHPAFENPAAPDTEGHEYADTCACSRTAAYLSTISSHAGSVESTSQRLPHRFTFAFRMHWLITIKGARADDPTQAVEHFSQAIAALLSIFR